MGDEARLKEILNRVKYVEEHGGLRTREITNMACFDSRWLLEQLAKARTALDEAEKSLEDAKLDPESGECDAPGPMYAECHNDMIDLALDSIRSARGKAGDNGT